MPGFIQTQSASSIRVKLQSESKSNWSVRLVYRAGSTAGAHTRTHARTPARTHTHTHTHAHARAHPHAHTRAHPHARTPTRARARAHTCTRAHTHIVLLVWMNLTIIQETKEDLVYEEMSISSGSSPMFTSKRSWTSLSVRASPSSDTNVMARPFVPNLPARATYTKTPVQLTTLLSQDHRLQHSRAN